MAWRMSCCATTRHPLRHAGIAVVGHGQGLPGEQAARAAQGGSARIQRAQAQGGAVGLHVGCPGPVRRVVHKAGEIDVEMPAEVVQQVERADLVALVRRVGNAVAEEQERWFRHTH